MNRTLFDTIFNRIHKGGLTVRYWDGEEVNYGDGESLFKITFEKRPELTSLVEDPTLILGEMYMDGDIHFEGKMDNLLKIMADNDFFNPIHQTWSDKLLSSAWGGLVSFKEKVKQKENIHAHYDLGNDFFALWLDETMCYSCGYFRHPDDTLHQAQLQKIDLILKKMRLKPGMRILDIGCGWGWLIHRAAEQYGVKALGITLSEEQYEGAKARIEKDGLSEQVEVRLVNYLDLDPKEDQFDRIISVGMFEHVGRGKLATYMDKVHSLLVPGGLSMLHTLTNLREYDTNKWIKKYIFPGGYIPSLRETLTLFPDYEFHTLHIESLRRHYARTLDLWYENFTQQLDQVRAMFDERFIRMWSLYLLCSAASLRMGSLDIHQIVFSKGPNNDLPMTLEDIYCEEASSKAVGN